jgi:hypothetical protein
VTSGGPRPLLSLQGRDSEDGSHSRDNAPSGWMEVPSPAGQRDNSIAQKTTLQPVPLYKNNLILRKNLGVSPKCRDENVSAG